MYSNHPQIKSQKWYPKLCNTWSLPHPLPSAGVLKLKVRWLEGERFGGKYWNLIKGGYSGYGCQHLHPLSIGDFYSHTFRVSKCYAVYFLCNGSVERNRDKSLFSYFWPNFLFTNIVKRCETSAIHWCSIWHGGEICCDRGCRNFVPGVVFFEKTTWNFMNSINE